MVSASLEPWRVEQSRDTRTSGTKDTAAAQVTIAGRAGTFGSAFHIRHDRRLSYDQ